MNTKLLVKRVPLNTGGYDRTGEYFGVGMPLYHFESQDLATVNGRMEDDICGYIRAYDRKDAKVRITHMLSFPVTFAR